MIEITDKTVGLWFIEWEGVDWLAHLKEVLPEKKYELTHRFRYHKDDKVFDSEDEKRWYQGTLTGTRPFVLLNLRELAKKIKDEIHGVQVYEYLMDDKGVDDLMRRFTGAPFAYAKMEKAERATGKQAAGVTKMPGPRVGKRRQPKKPG